MEIPLRASKAQALESLIPGTKGGLFPAGDVASINGEAFAPPGPAVEGSVPHTSESQLGVLAMGQGVCPE